MRMAKPSEKDIEIAGNMMSVLSQLDRGDYPILTEDDHRPDYFDPEDFEHLRHFYNLFAKSLEIAPNWHGRVIGGMCYVILYDQNEIVDPSLDVLELHPKHIKAQDRIKQLEQQLATQEQNHIPNVEEMVEQKTKATNEYGLDARYFHEKLGLIVRDVNQYTPDEMRRTLLALVDCIQARPESKEQFCDNNCTWLDHSPECTLLNSSSGER